MNKYKKQLIIFLFIEAVITIIDKLFGRPLGADWYGIVTNLSYWLGMAWGGFIIFYAFKIKCKHCHTGQVFRGFSAFDIRWPQDRCYRCAEPIE